MNKILLYLLLIPSFLSAQKSKINVKPFLERSIQVNDIELTPDGSVIMATNKMLFEISNLEIPLQLLDNTYIQSTCYSENGKLYAAGTNVLYDVFNKKQIPLQDTNVKINDITCNNDYIYLGTDKGIYIYKIDTKQWSKLTSENCDLKSNDISFIKADKKNSIWAGTNKGYAEIRNNKLKLHDENKNIQAGTITDDGILIVTNKDIIDIKNGQKKTLEKYNQLKSNTINAISKDKEGRIYIASQDLYRYTPETGYIERYSSNDGLKGGKIQHLQVDQKGDVWLGTKGNGVFKVNFEQSKFDELSATIDIIKPIRCTGDSNGEVKVIPTGGRRPYKYFWNGVESSNDTKDNLKAGFYEVQIMDSRGKTFNLGYSLKNPPPFQIIELAVEHTHENSTTGSIRLDVTGGVGQIKYKWSNNAKNKAKNNSATGLTKGIYKVAAYDENLCIIEKTIELKTKTPSLKKGMIINLKNLKFEADSSKIVAKHHVALDRVVESLKANPNISIEIGGHTNTIPEANYCKLLSGERAKNVANYIISKGIRKERVTHKGYGKTQPKDRSRTMRARRINQRVEIKITSL